MSNSKWRNLAIQARWNGGNNIESEICLLLLCFGYDNEFEKEDEFKHNTSVHSVELAPFLGLTATLTFSFSFAEFFFWQQMWKTSFRATNLTLRVILWKKNEERHWYVFVCRSFWAVINCLEEDKILAVFFTKTKKSRKFPVLIFPRLAKWSFDDILTQRT